MAKFNDTTESTLVGYFNAGDQPTEAQFTALMAAIQAGIDEHDHVGAAAGDGAQLGYGEMLFTPDDLLLLNFQRWLKNPGDAHSKLIGSRLEQIVHQGALRYVPGRFPGSRALAVEPAGTNYELNPLMLDADSSGLADGWAYWDNFGSGGDATQTVVAHPIANRGWLQRLQYTAVAGDASNQTQVYSNSPAGSFAQGDSATVSMDIKGSLAGCVVRLVINECDVVGEIGTSHLGSNFTISSTLARVSYTTTTVDADCDYLVASLQIHEVDDGDTLDTYLGAVNIEKTAYATSLIHGDAGPGYAYTGAPNNSTSTRTATEVNLGSQVDLISGNDTFTITMWVQMPFDADATDWASLYPYCIDAEGAGNNHLGLRYDMTNDRFQTYINGAWRVLGTAQTFKAGDWLAIVSTHDFATNSHKQYINGQLDASATTVLSAPTLTEWNLGSAYNGAYQSGFGFDGFAVFDRVLTAAEIAGLYANQRPLIDAGALETRPTVPGVSAGYWQMLSVACTHTGDANYAEAETAAGTMESRTTFAGAWVDGQIQFEAILKNSDAGAVDDANAKLQYYHTASAAWVDVPDSIVAVTASTSTPNRVRSAALALPQQEYEYRVVIATPDDAGETVTIYKAGLVASPGGSTLL